jgi:hypothetical protein
MTLLAGHLQFAAYGIGALTIVFVASFFVRQSFEGTGLHVIKTVSSRDGVTETETESIPERPQGVQSMSFRWTAAIGIAAILLGVLLAVPQLEPVLKYGSLSHRRNSPTSEGYQSYVGSALKPFELANISNATALGSPRVPLALEDQTTISQYWPPLVKQGANFAESAICLGPLLLALLFVVPWRNRQTWSIAVVTFGSLLLALGTVLNAPLYYLVPGWSATGSPGRIAILFVLGACVLCGVGVTELVERPTKKKLLLACVGAGLGFVLALVGPLLAPGPTGGSAQTIDQIANEVTRSQIPVMIANTFLGIVAVFVLGRPTLGRLRFLVLLAPVILWATNLGDIIPTGKPLDPITGFKDQERIAFVNQNWPLLVAPRAQAPANLASLSGVHELSGYDSLMDRDAVELLRDIDGQDPAPPANGNMMFIKPTADPRKLADAGVTTVVAPDGNHQLPGPGRFVLKDGHVTVGDEGYDHLALDVEGEGLLVVKDRNMPGWNASVDGRPQTLPAGIWRSVDLGARGNHRVVFTYRPSGLVQGLMIGGLAWIVLVGLAIRGLFDHRAARAIRNSP